MVVYRDSNRKRDVILRFATELWQQLIPPVHALQAFIEDNIRLFQFASAPTSSAATSTALTITEPRQAENQSSPDAACLDAIRVFLNYVIEVLNLFHLLSQQPHSSDVLHR